MQPLARGAPDGNLPAPGRTGPPRKLRRCGLSRTSRQAGRSRRDTRRGAPPGRLPHQRRWKVASGHHPRRRPLAARLRSFSRLARRRDLLPGPDDKECATAISRWARFARQLARNRNGRMVLVEPVRPLGGQVRARSGEQEQTLPDLFAFRRRAFPRSWRPRTRSRSFAGIT